MTRIWSLRHSIAWGWFWHLERDCELDDAPAWLTVFRTDEPGVAFCEGKRRPRMRRH